jgi:glycosyltransferase involved in cell wall biosynthesis
VFKAWNIVNNLLGGSAFGHVLWETKLLVEALRQRGTEARVLGHNSIKAETYPGARVIPAFDLHYAHPISEDPEWGYLENFVVHNLAYEKALMDVDRGLFADALTVFVDIGERHLLGAVRWLQRFDETARPHVAMILQGRLGMVLKGQNEWSKTNPAPDMYRKIWACCPSAVKRHITLCTRSDMYLSKYEQIFGQTPHMLPFAMGPTEREFEATRERIGSREDRPLVVSFLAGSRLERGAGLIPDVVKQCAPLGVRFLIQLSDVEVATSELAASLSALRERSDVRFHDGMLPRAEYNDWIAQSVVLLPYDGARYQSRFSGVYVEAKCFGSPVIVPAGTWMAEEVLRLGNGLVFEDYTAVSIAKCIMRAQAELTALRERAAACAAEYRRGQGADRFIDALENLVARNGPVSSSNGA